VIVVTDTSPLRYLALIGIADLLPRLFESVVCHQRVFEEASHPAAPDALRLLMAARPAWLIIMPDLVAPDALTQLLDPGESAAIALAESCAARLLLMDERKGRQVAERRGLKVAGTLNILAEAAARGWLDFDATVRQLRTQTNFRVTDHIAALVQRLTMEP